MIILLYLCSEIWCLGLRLRVKREPGVNPGQTALLCAPGEIPAVDHCVASL